MVAWKIIKATYTDFLDDECMANAAGIAYYTIFSLPPLLVLVFGIANVFGVPQTTMERIVSEQAGLPIPLSDDESEVSLASVADHEGEAKANPLEVMGPVSKILGVALLFFSASGVFGHLQRAMNRAWEVEPDPDKGGVWSMLTKRTISLGMVVVLGFLLLVSLVLTTTIDEISALVLGRDPGTLGLVVGIVVNNLIALVVTSVLFACMFQVLPDAKIAWKDTWVGALFTSLLFVVGKAGLGWYLQSSQLGSAWGSAASSMIALLVYVYYVSIIVLLGAELTQAWSREFGQGIKPADNAVRVVDAKTILKDGKAKTETTRDSNDDKLVDEQPNGDTSGSDATNTQDYLKLVGRKTNDE